MQSLPAPNSNEDPQLRSNNQFHNAGDSFDTDRGITDFYTPDARLNFENAPTIIGIDSIRATMVAQTSALASMKHLVGHVDVMPDRIYQEAEIHYVVKNDPEKAEIIVKGFAVFHKRPEESQMHQFDIYGDFSKVQEKIEQFMKS